jgi:hypothetical protein
MPKPKARAPLPPGATPATPWRLSVLPIAVPFYSHLQQLQQRQLPNGVSADALDISFISVGYDREAQAYPGSQQFLDLLPPEVRTHFQQIRVSFLEYDAAAALARTRGGPMSWERKVVLEFLDLSSKGTLLHGVLITYAAALDGEGGIAPLTLHCINWSSLKANRLCTLVFSQVF